ncbi:hypothetical protein [Actinoplanes sp. ATCC 53533]|uniref:hypothetical protein n=1 Tax=Actinoplanes sp. ATCC 53533 TaxID=1288362 RepID=UPI000F7B95AC|nr:hypothetical protein [Actinoplanes sp. ATCC 53533]
MIVGVHGIAQQQLGFDQLGDPWLRALRDGVHFALGRRPTGLELDMAFYGDVFLQQFADATKSAVHLDVPEALDDLSPDELADLSDAVEEASGDADAAGTKFPGVPGPVLQLRIT